MENLTMNQLDALKRLGLKERKLSKSTDVIEYLETIRIKNSLMKSIREQVKGQLLITDDSLKKLPTMKHWSEVSDTRLDSDKKKLSCILKGDKVFADLTISHRKSYKVKPTISMKIDNYRRGA
tara:strand:- start:769 stop:1137 length:369 start_codon:yes stop_codon:yes gene_type:complete